MKAEIKVPTVGESITEATIGEWAKKSGEFVKRDEIILLLDTDKASVEVTAPNDGVLTTTAKAGDTVKIGAVVAYIDTEGVATAGMQQPAKNVEKPGAGAGAVAGGSTSAAAQSAQSTAGTVPMTATASGYGTTSGASPMSAAGQKVVSDDMRSHLSPAVQRVVSERGLDPAQISGTGKDGRITKQDALATATGLVQNGPGSQAHEASSSAAMRAPQAATKTEPKKSELPALPIPKISSQQRGQRRQPMTNIRKKISERLVMSQQTTATLTTFNEIDMSAVMALRDRYKDKYKEKYGISLGFMGFFVKACVEALKEVPQVNAFIDKTDLIFNDFVHVGVAVGTDKGLIVPVIKDADLLSIAEIELAIRHYALKARDGKISVDDLSGGTFTISNGGVYGSLMSTPILNPPQSGILGMHKIEERPVVSGGKIEIRPMMYIALSYDHRVIDGKEAVTFLVKVKEGIEDPTRLLLEI